MTNQAFGISLDDSQSPITLRNDLLEPSSMLCATADVDSDAGVNVVPLVGFLVVGTGLACAAAAVGGLGSAMLLVVGAALGIALFRSRFGFASAWRRLLNLREADGLQAQAILLIVASTSISLICAHGLGAFGSVPRPSAFPLGIPLALGALLFGLGMQFGGSCASGTLFAVGAGQSTILFTLFGFIVGATAQAAMSGVTSHLWQTHGVLLSDHVGWLGSWLVTVATLSGVIVLLRWRWPSPPADPRDAEPSARELRAPALHPRLDALRRPWPATVGATVIGLLAGAVFLLAGRPWGITLAFSEWGSRVLGALGLHPQHWYFWQQAPNSHVLSTPLLSHDQTLTDLGIIVGAAIAACLCGAWRFRGKVSRSRKVQGIVGGILMGVGARMSGGCNIGSYIGGISIGSVSGWVWAAFALVGTSFGLRVRRRLGMAALNMTESVC